MTTTPMRSKDFAALVTLAGCWGASFLLIRIAVPAFGPVSLMAARVLVSSVLLWIGLRAMGRAPVGLRGNVRHLLVLGVVNAALPFVLVAFAEQYLSASLAAVLIATSPLFSAVLSARGRFEQAKGERIDLPRGGGMLLGIIGVGVLVGWSPIALDGITLISILATLVAAASYAYAGEYTARHLADVPSPTLALGQQLGAAAWLVVPAMFNAPAVSVSAGALWALFGLSAICTATAYLLYFHLIAQIGPVRTNSVTYLIPFFGILWGTLFLGEALTPQMLLGLAFILTSVLLMNGAPAKRRPVVLCAAFDRFTPNVLSPPRPRKLHPFFLVIARGRASKLCATEWSVHEALSPQWRVVATRAAFCYTPPLFTQINDLGTRSGTTTC
jgi:drug/metabolite transporter (DMT)-like permease